MGEQVEAALKWLQDCRDGHIQWAKSVSQGFEEVKPSDVGDEEWHNKCVKEYDKAISVLTALREENKRYKKAIANVRANYPESVFPPDSDSIDARSGTLARKICDNILKEYAALSDQEEGK